MEKGELMKCFFCWFYTNQPNRNSSEGDFTLQEIFF